MAFAKRLGILSVNGPPARGMATSQQPIGDVRASAHASARAHLNIVLPAPRAT
jgi:hypothetical protein